MKKTSLLPDVNVWLALSFRTHKHHASANAWFASLADESIFFCRTTQQGFLRVATNAAAFPKDAVTLSGAWKLYDSILMDPRVQYINEPLGVEPQWRMYAQGSSYSPKIWSDAYLAAFAKVADFEFATFDTGFKQYPGLSLTLLK